MMDLNGAQLKSLYLHNASHTLPFSPLSKIYTQKLRLYNHTKGINYPAVYANGAKTCLSCNQIQVPGVNVKVKNKGTKVVYVCGNCRYGNVVAEIEVKEPKSANVIGSVNTAKDVKPPVVLKAVQVDKDPKKVVKPKKKRSLASMLQEKKQKASSASSTLDLMEFMKQ